MQLSLGGLIGQGPAQQNRMTATRSGLLRSRDSLQFYGWWTTGLRTGDTDSDSGVRYRTPIRRVGPGSLIGGGGLEYWYFPTVMKGTRDVVVDSYLGWTGREENPITISANAKTLVRSDLQKGTFMCMQALETRKLFSAGGLKFAVQHGPAYIYNWDVYSRPGHRAFRYYGTLLASRGAWTAEAMLRPQLGLQRGIPDNKYWSVAVIRRFSL